MLDENIKENEQVEAQEVEAPAQEQSVVEKPYNEVVEEARKDLYKSYTMSRRISNILMFVVVGAIVGIMFLVISNNQVLKIVGYCSAGALLLGMILYYVLSRKGFPNKTKDYMASVTQILRDRQFKDTYENVSYNPEEKMVTTDFSGDGIYKEIAGTNSRNIVRMEYKGHHVLYGEVALLRPAQKRVQVPPLFVGKYISLPNELEFEGRFVIVYKNPKQPYDLPNDVDDLVALEEKEDLVVYGPEGADFRKVLGSNFVNDVRRFRLDNRLFNINIAVWAGHSAAYLSYDDAVMAIPFDKPFDYEGFEQSCKDVDSIVKLLAGE